MNPRRSLTQSAARLIQDLRQHTPIRVTSSYLIASLRHPASRLLRYAYRTPASPHPSGAKGMSNMTYFPETAAEHRHISALEELLADEVTQAVMRADHVAAPEVRGLCKAVGVSLAQRTSV